MNEESKDMLRRMMSSKGWLYVERHIRSTMRNSLCELIEKESVEQRATYKALKNFLRHVYDASETPFPED